MRVIDLALKDLLQISRDWKAALFLVVMPIVFTAFFGFVFGSGTEDDPRLPVGIVDHDQAGAFGGNLRSLLEASEAVRPVVLEDDEVEKAGELVRDGAVVAVVLVPAGFSEQTRAGTEPRLAVIVDQSTQTGHMVSTALRAIVTRLLGASRIAGISAQMLEVNEPFESDAARQAFLDEGLALASEAWRQPPITVSVEPAGGTAEDQEPANPFTQSSPGMIVQFVVAGLTASSMVLVLERRSRALQRLLTTPITKAEVIGGHVLAMFLVVFLQQVFLVAVGQLAFGVDYMRAPLGTLLMMAALALWTACLGLLIGAIAKSEEQTITWSLVAMFIFSALGGAWFPLEMTGSTFSTIGHLTPTAWAMDGFQNIVIRHLELSSVLLPAGILLAYAALFFGLAVWRFRIE